MKLAVVGLGKLGSCIAAIMARKGHDVTGVDVNATVIEAINVGEAPVEEPGLQDLIDGAQGRLTATSDVASAVRTADACFIVVPTPSKLDGSFSTRAVEKAADAIGAGLSENPGRPVVVLSSTVMPGDVDRVLVPTLERTSGKVCGRDFGVCYNPEFIALGNVIHDMLNPDFILVGESDPASGDLLAEIYGGVCDNAPPVMRMSFVNAELAKLAVNTFVTTRISYANMLAQICERLAGADVGVITDAIGHDSRIGHNYLQGAVSYGGPCFPRDNAALGQLARRIGAPAMIAEATESMNRLQMDRLAETVLHHLPAGATVGILGLSYKPKTPVIEASAGIDLMRRLVAENIDVISYDPQAMPAARALFRDTVKFAQNTAECASAADLLLITTPWNEFRDLSPSDIKTGATVIDCWRILPRHDFESACNYITMGTGPAAADLEVKRTRSARL